MKKVILASIFSSLVLVSCQKDTNSAESKLPTRDLNFITGDGHIPVATLPDWSEDCIPPAIECLPEVVIVANNNEYFSEMLFAMAESKLALRTYLNSANQDIGNNFFGELNFNKLKSGEYTAAVVNSGINDNKKTIIVGDYNSLQKGNHVNAYPISFDD